MSDLEFHTFDAGHLPEAAAVFSACFNSPPWEDGWSVESASQRLGALLAFPTAIGFVVARRKRLLGLALGHSEPWANGLHFYLNELCIDVRDQRHGVGSALVAHLICRLKERGIRDMYLLTERASTAESFFREQGFEEDAGAIKLWRSV